MEVETAKLQKHLRQNRELYRYFFSQRGAVFFQDCHKFEVTLLVNRGVGGFTGSICTAEVMLYTWLATPTCGAGTESLCEAGCYLTSRYMWTLYKIYTFFLKNHLLIPSFDLWLPSRNHFFFCFQKSPVKVWMKLLEDSATKFIERHLHRHQVNVLLPFCLVE